MLTTIIGRRFLPAAFEIADPVAQYLRSVVTSAA